MMERQSHSVGCLILACGNTLRGDDGVGPWLADWAAERFAAEPPVRVISRHQWTPDLAEDIASAESVVFVDCAVRVPPGAVRVVRVVPARADGGLATHHAGAAELLALSEELYASLPRNALLLTVGAGSTEMGEGFSKSVNDALPEACKTLESAVLRLLAMQSE
jgi:hydrogenase maturation protease